MKLAMAQMSMTGSMDENLKRSLAFCDAAAGSDLLFFPGHVAMYLGDGRFVHSTSHVGTHGVAVNSLTPGDPLFRPDLLETMTGAGSIF